MAKPQNVHGPWVGATAVLFVLLMGTGMFYYQFYVLPIQMGPPHTPQNLTFNITEVQWKILVNGTIDTQVTPIQVHVGDNVTFHIHSVFQQDPSYTQHGFFIQGVMDLPVTVSASKDVTVTITPTQPGEYTIICTIYCGTGHPNMHGLLDVLP